MVPTEMQHCWYGGAAFRCLGKDWKRGECYAREPAATQFVEASVEVLQRYLCKKGELEDQKPCLTMSWRGTPLTQAREVAVFLTSWALGMLFGTSQLMALHSQKDKVEAVSAAPVSGLVKRLLFL